jgi:4-hydroxy-tetrahydrodipicolinate reductase
MRVGFYGAGAMAREIAGACFERGHEPVAALDIRRPPAPLDGAFVETPGELIAARPDVVVHSTPRDGDMIGQISELLEAGCNVISLSGIIHLSSSDPSGGARLDRAAREHDVSVVGTGVNPGFVLDLVPIFFCGACVRVRRVEARRVVDLRGYGDSVFEMYGIGLSEEEFARAVNEGRITLHRELVQSAHLIAEAAGIELGPIEEQKLPVLEDGRVAGFHHICRAGGAIELELNGLMRLDEAASTAISITGDPDLRIVLSDGFSEHPERIVAARVVNLFEWLIDSPPGLRSVAELPTAVSTTRAA